MRLKDRFNKYVSQLEKELDEDVKNELIDEFEPFEEEEEEEDEEIMENNNREELLRERSAYAQTAAKLSAESHDELSNPVATSTLSADTRITGDIFTESNLVVDGQVTGNIESTQDVLINGSLEGNVTGLNISVSKNISGEIVAMSDVLVGSEANVIGDITASNIKVKGVVSGNVRASGKVELTKTSSLYGDINCSAIKVDEGAIISGRIEIEQNNED